MEERPPAQPSPRKRSRAVWFRKPVFKIVLSLFLFVFIAVSAVALHYYQYYSNLIDRRLNGEVFQRTARLYATPFQIYAGQKISADTVVSRLQRAGLEPEGGAHSGEGTYELNSGRLTINPASGEPLQLQFQGNTISRIAKKRGEVDQATLPLELVTHFSDDNRQKRRVVEFSELPPMLVNALVAAEDNRFYSHFGIDPIRLTGAVFQAGGKFDRIRGTSTITQQLARNFFLNTERKGLAGAIRKSTEIFISILLEQRLTKQQIMTLYANDVYLGARGSFSIKGFGEGAAAYFGKDLTALTLPEAATLAAIIPAPSGMYSPTRHGDAVKERRNMVLENMAGMGFIKPEAAKAAKATDLKLAPIQLDVSDAPYLVDYIRESLLTDFSEEILTNDSLRVETTFDPGLQKAAVDALVKGLNEVNNEIAKRNKGRKTANKLPMAQAAVIVLDSKTAAIRAMVGGGNYGESQYNRITQAFRQPGSVFKPFVYAAAFEDCERRLGQPTTSEAPAEDVPEPSQLVPGALASNCLTPVTIFDDVATTFTYDLDKIYEPNNYHQVYYGPVTMRWALEHSLNVPTIKIAEAIGYDKVADLAKRSGMNAKIKGYPSIALGAFEVTPLEVARAYTVFVNEGRRLEPHALVRVLDSDGRVLKPYRYPAKEVLSPQVAYLMTHIMEGVVSQGTAAGVRGRGFTLPAAGKTGTSRDGWFAGFTKEYLVIAWVGFDDNSDLDIDGSRSALPIWTDFMLKAQELYPPRDPDSLYFSAPEGVLVTSVEKDRHTPPALGCQQDYTEAFLPGSIAEPVSCRALGEEPTNNGLLDRIERTLSNLFGR